MQDWGNTRSNMEYRTKIILAEVEQNRLAKLAASARSEDERGSGGRRMAMRLGDLVAGLWCQLQSRFATDPGATAC